MLIRHGEKPEVPPPFGVNADGVEDKHSLSVRGWQRAGALARFFRSPTAKGITTPTKIYASGIGEDAVLVDGDDVAKSLRPQQTVAPLAAAIGLAVDTSCKVGEETKLANSIDNENGVVLVAWEHKHIPIIAQQFTGSAPNSWPGGSVFDVVWVLQRNGAAYDFSVVPQGLLSGDKS